MTVRFRNTTGEDRVCPWLGGIMCAAGEVVETPDDQYENWVAAGWEPLDPDPSESPPPPPADQPAA